MAASIVGVNAIIKELADQRNRALKRSAELAGELAEVHASLSEAWARIQALEQALPSKEQTNGAAGRSRPAESSAATAEAEAP